MKIFVCAALIALAAVPAFAQQSDHAVVDVTLGVNSGTTNSGRFYDGREAFDAQRKLLQGAPPSPANPPSGSRFHTRCPLAQPLCKEKQPVLTQRPGASDAGQHWVACHFR